MYTIRTKYLWMESIFHDLDAIELLTLGRIFMSAHETVAASDALREKNPEGRDALLKDLSMLAIDAQIACTIRCRSLSNANEMLMYMPSRREWRQDDVQL